MSQNALEAFLLARFAEDEQASPVVHDVSVCSSPPVFWDSCPCGVPRRWLEHLMVRRQLALKASEPGQADAVLDVLPGLTHTVEDVAGRCRDGQERRWLAAALAALSHHVQVGTLPEPLPSLDPSNTSNLSGPPGCSGGGRDLAARAPGLPTPRRHSSLGVAVQAM